jgi:predicted naringenin-chalcone synthase
MEILMKDVYLHKIETVVPEKSYTQEFARDFFIKLIADTDIKKRFLKRIYENSGIEKRYSVIDDYDKDPADFKFYPKNADFKPEPSTAHRNDWFIKESNRLSLMAVNKLLDKLPGFDKEKITHLITVSCTGFAAPGFDFHIVKNLELSKSINRFHLGFMGCFAAFPAMKLARNICLSEPNARVLIVNVELCTLHFRQDYDPEIIVANAIFADGVSAAIVSSHSADYEGDKIILHDFASRYVSDSENAMAWKIGDKGFDMVLSAYVPRIIEANIGSIIDEILDFHKVKRGDIAFWGIHPGGRAILNKIETSLGLKKEDLSQSYEVLRNYGNMSSTTVMFVLNEIMKSPEYGKIFSASFGPGLTIESGYFEKIKC